VPNISALVEDIPVLKMLKDGYSAKRISKKTKFRAFFLPYLLRGGKADFRLNNIDMRTIYHSMKLDKEYNKKKYIQIKALI
jgi:hypothetical protein